MQDSRRANLHSQFPKIQDWQLTEQLSRSHWNEVYRACATGSPLGSRGDYVLKIASGTDENAIAGKLLKREAQIAQTISHRNLVSVLDANFDHEPWFIIQPYISGVDLQTMLDCRSSVSVPCRLWIVRQVAQALQALHDQRVVHCDVSPRNVMLSAEGHATLIDLGLAQVLENEQLPANHLAGSLDYLAPEQLEGEDHLTAAIDVYALGVMAFQCLTDQLPTRHMQLLSDRQSIHQKISKPNLGRRFGVEIAELLTTMLDRQPRNRPAIGEVISQLVRQEVNSFALRVAA